MMAALLLYCYFKGIRSSRKIAAACVDDLGCRVICGGAAPSHRAVVTFIRRHRPRDQAAVRAGAVAAGGRGRGRRAGRPRWTGPRCRGNASRFANLDAGQLAGPIAAVEAAIDAEAEAWLAGAAAGAASSRCGTARR